MLKTYHYNRRGLILLLVLVFMHVCRYSQGQRIEDCRRFNGYVCTKFANCPSGPELVRNQIATLCGFENGAAKICCPASKPPTIATVSPPSVTPPNTTAIPTRTPIKLTPSPTRPTPTTVTRRTPPTVPASGRPTPTPTPAPAPTVRQPVRTSSKNATATAILKCEEYAKYQYVTKHFDPLLPGEVGSEYQELDCVKFATLIVNGIPAEPKEFPHMVLLGYGNNFRNVEWACGGSLISEKFVLSAAHCGNSDLGEAKWALVGDLNATVTSASSTQSPSSSNAPTSMRKVYSISRRFNHPNYKPPSIYNDITLLELNTTVEMSPFVRPACLFTSTSNQVRTQAHITGWGLTGAAERRSNQLLKTTIQFEDEEICRAEYSTANKLERGYDPETMVCAGDLVTGNDTCPGDSGGPLQLQVNGSVCMWAVVGITSIGPGICGNMETPGIYTKVANYLGWIQSIVWP